MKVTPKADSRPLVRGLPDTSRANTLSRLTRAVGRAGLTSSRWEWRRGPGPAGSSPPPPGPHCVAGGHGFHITQL